MQIDEYERLYPHAVVDGVIFHTPNRQCLWRVETLYTKEPDTIEWIRSMKPGEVLFDVGANMGQYSMLAAKQGVKVHAFEPESQNFALLCRNIATNHLENSVTPWPLALSNSADIAVMHLSGMSAGGSCHSFGASTDYNGKTKQFSNQQGSVSTTLDYFASQFGLPDHIKIDVDGFEHLVIDGARLTLASAKSVLVEINTHYAEHMDILVPLMLSFGFHYSEEQVESSKRKSGPFAGIGNWIFYR